MTGIGSLRGPIRPASELALKATRAVTLRGLQPERDDLAGARWGSRRENVPQFLVSRRRQTQPPCDAGEPVVARFADHLHFTVPALLLDAESGFPQHRDRVVGRGAVRLRPAVESLPVGR